MQVNQIYAILNDVMAEVTGQAVKHEGEEPAIIIQEDLSNIVDVGTKIFNNGWKDNYVKALIDRIGREVYVDRNYEGYAPKVLRDSWEYGSIMSKTRCKIFDAKANPAWSLEAGQTVNQFEFNPPEIVQTFFNTRTSWQIDCSFTDIQLKESFNNAAAMNRFISMIENRIRTSKTIYIDSLVMRTINNMIAEKIHLNKGVVDVLSLYNATVSTPITAADTITDKDFQRFLALTISLCVERFRAPSTNFNYVSDDEYVTFTPKEYAHLVLHADMAKAMEVYLQSETYHNELVKIGDYETVPFWQAQGDGYQLATTSRINCKLASDNTQTVDRNYIIGVLFDRDALGVVCENQRTLSSFNSNGEYYNNFYKTDSGYFNDLAENCLVFVLGDGDIPSVTLSASTATATLPSTTASVSATVSPAGSSVTWTSSDPTIATVSSGTITPVKAGKCTVYASITVDGVTYSAPCAVTVNAANKSK